MPGEEDCGPVSWVKDAEVSLSMAQSMGNMGRPPEISGKKTNETDSEQFPGNQKSDAADHTLLHQASSECVDICPVDGKSWKSFCLKIQRGGKTH